MNTAFNLMNSPADSATASGGVAAADKRGGAIDDSTTDKSQGDSPFAAMLQKESSGSKSSAEKAGGSAGKASPEESGKTDSERGDAAGDAVNSGTEATSAVQGDSKTTLSPELSDGREQNQDDDAEAAKTLLLTAEPALQPATAARPGSAEQALGEGAANLKPGTTDGVAVNAMTSKTGQVPSAAVDAENLSAAITAPGDSLTDAEQATRPLVITRIHQGQVFSQSESYPAAGKTLPQSGKNLPAGIFFNSDGSSETELRFSDTEQANQSFDAGTGKQRTGLGVEFNADNLLRSLVAGKTAPTLMNPDPGALAAQPGSSAGSETVAPPLLNPTLQVGADKALGGSRSPLLPGLEASTQFSITAEAGSSEWGNQLSSRIRWMGNLNLSSAELKLHPAELGTVEIQISTEDDQTRVSFVTSNAAAKEIIESSLPRLKDLLNESGLQLQQGDVAHKESDDRQAGGNSEASGHMNSDEDRALEENMLHISRKSNSQIDHYV